ncbi:ATP-binding protein [Paraburkholderia sp. EG287A]|uniref:hybrid sensor histidine kinase/response regulator n=1 Tax=unclassified Paraburkholderia TaxID=2615204 RepID=UPI0034D34C86
MTDGNHPVGARLADYLMQRRAQLTRRWLRMVSQQMHIRPLTREGVVGLMNQLPLLFDELCALLSHKPAPDDVVMRALHGARLHAGERWRQGFALDELYLELDLLQRCVQAFVRDYFAQAPTRAGQAALHEAVEQFFSDTIRGAVRQYQAQLDRRVDEALGERDRAFAAERRSEARLRIAAEAAGLGIFEWDPVTDAAVWENARMYEITGQPAAKGPLGKEEFVATVTRVEDVTRLRDMLKTAQESSGEFHVVVGIRKIQTGAHCMVEISARFMNDASGSRQVLVGTLADVTGRVSAEQTLRDADRHKDTFLATLAHELRNPLAPILNAAHLLSRPETDPRQLRWIRDVIERHARHMAHLIDDLLDLSRISAGKLRLSEETFDVRTCIESAVEIHAPAAAAHRHQLEVLGIQGAPLFVRGDPIRITQVLSNLVDNAVKYAGDGGHIRVSVSSTAGRVSIAVEDDGIGMEPSLIPSMFEMFGQAPDGGAAAKAGLGIGLSVARSVMVMHGGTIDATSEGPGRGSRFTVSLPLCNEPPARCEKSEPADVEPASPPRRVLIVDDNSDAALSLAQVLDSHDVRIATTGRQALEIVSAGFRPEIILLDLGLPDMSGYDVARQLAERVSVERPILVALTGYGQPEERERTRHAGFAHHLVKPVPVEEVLRLVAAGG